MLTSFARNSNPGFPLAMRDGADVAAFKGPFVGAILDPTYVISKPNSCIDMLYSPENTDPRVIEDTDHNDNLYLNVPDNFQLMLDWIERRVGNAGLLTETC